MDCRSDWGCRGTTELGRGRQNGRRRPASRERRYGDYPRYRLVFSAALPVLVDQGDEKETGKGRALNYLPHYFC